MQLLQVRLHPVLDDRPVSILIQPEGRMQRGNDGLKFQPALAVSILIQPEGRMQQQRNQQMAEQQEQVSILIQPEGRMQLRPYPR